MKCRTPALFVLAIACAASVWAKSENSYEIMGDAIAIEGKWKVVGYEYSGRKRDSPRADRPDTIRDGQWFRPNRRTSIFKFTLNPTKKPKSTDLTATRLGDEKLNR